MFHPPAGRAEEHAAGDENMHSFIIRFPETTAGSADFIPGLTGSSRVLPGSPDAAGSCRAPLGPLGAYRPHRELPGPAEVRWVLSGLARPRRILPGSVNLRLVLSGPAEPGRVYHGLFISHQTVTCDP